jgi:hypothetical protein
MYTLGQSAPPAGTTPEYPILDTVTALVQALGATYQNVKLTDLNSELIRQGKAPLSPEQAQALSPRIDVGISGDTQSMLLMGAGIIGGVVLLSALVKRR